MPSKLCADCNGTGVMHCPDCKDRRINIRLSADHIMQPPWVAYNVLKRMQHPNENMVQSMKDPKIANFWLITMPQVLGGVNFDEDEKKKIWWRYKESMRYNHLRDVVAKREPGWEDLQDILISIDPKRAKEDPIIVKNVPYYKAKQALQAEIMNLAVPPRPNDWGYDELDLPLNAYTFTKEELNNPSTKSEIESLLNAQKEMADSILDAQWESKWREDKLNEVIKEKTQSYIQNGDADVLPEPIIMPQPSEEKKKPNKLVEEMASYMPMAETSLPQSLILQCQELEKKKAARQLKWWQRFF
ncbi:hypothetical protein ZOSMA_2G02790 [Zostera marina]|uniref:AtTam37 zinc finger domain-containing protein n=1 Tax=Zostera marina TaxID=29655 RepID=A0A0K9PB04_ZOSMR|nr:hypothetical protein ZOSMA_2G02790 [Zostera marina]